MKITPSKIVLSLPFKIAAAVFTPCKRVRDLQAHAEFLRSFGDEAENITWVDLLTLRIPHDIAEHFFPTPVDFTPCGAGVPISDCPDVKSASQSLVSPSLSYVKHKATCGNTNIAAQECPCQTATSCRSEVP